MQLPRRSFIKWSSISTALFGISSWTNKKSIPPAQARLEELHERMSARPIGQQTVVNLKKAPISQVKVAMLGLGNRGTGQAKLVNSLYPAKAVITAICDIRPARLQTTLDTLKKSGQNPAVYGDDEHAWKEMLRRDDIDLVVICTPWADHGPMALYAMDQGKHVAMEVPAVLTLDHCWALVNKAEETQLNCMMLENVCYGEEELWLLNMVQKGVFGTLTYGEAAYIHNLRESLFGDEKYYNDWRLRHHIEQDGNLYPTHGLGPIAQYMDINRGDKFNHLVSMSSREASLSEYAETIESSNEFYRRKDFAHGDMNTTLIKTAQGRSIMVQHDVVTPRPYSRINAIAGTKAFHEGYPSRLSVAGKGHEWLDEMETKDYQEKYKHPIWEKLKEGIAENGGHGGMDFVQMYRLIDCLNNGWPLDMDVYDAASWSSVVELSKISTELGSVPVRCPDFTRGAWKENRPLGIFEYI